MKQGAFTFVLHSHIPYARRAGRWPHGEEWVHEAAADTYLPLLLALRTLHAEGVPFRLTIGITPVLAEQLADPLILNNLRRYLAARRDAAAADMARLDARGARTAAWYRDRYDRLLAFLTGELNLDILGAFRALQDQGHLDIAAGAATHGYLPLLDRDSSVHAQVHVGVESYRRTFGRQPRSFWLPECAYRPARYREGPEGAYLRPGLERFLAEHGIRVFFAETHTVEGGRPVGKAAGDAVGPYAAVPRRYAVPPARPVEPTARTAHLPYRVEASPVAVMGRNRATGLQVWSARHGYPGDPVYREFHKRDGVSGLHYWRVTGQGTDLAEKDAWDPDAAFARTEEHARHFCGLVEDLTAGFRERDGRYGVVAAAYDTELFGHWWFEGVAWLAAVLRRLARSPVVDLTTAADYVEQHPPEEALSLPESSWGQGGGHFTWQNVDTAWMWPAVHAAERRMERLAAAYPEAAGDVRAALQQAARELLLLQSSDWPFLITTGQARDYAVARFQGHLERFRRMAAAVESGAVDAASVQELFALDNVFPEIDHRSFARREPVPV